MIVGNKKLTLDSQFHNSHHHFVQMTSTLGVSVFSISDTMSQSMGNDLLTGHLTIRKHLYLHYDS